MTNSSRIFPRNFKTGFPTAPVLDKDLLQSHSSASSSPTSKTKTKKKSLFAQQFARSKNTHVFGEQPRQRNLINNDGKPVVSLGEGDQIHSGECSPKVHPSSSLVGVENSSEKDQIEKENERILSEMNEQEILQEREKLLKTLG